MSWGWTECASSPGRKQDVYKRQVQRQMVEICKAAAHENLKVLLLDEPTSFLPTERIGQLHSYLKKLCADKNIAIIYISHKLDEVEQICETVNVMKNGVNTETVSYTHLEENVTLPKQRV